MGNSIRKKPFSKHENITIHAQKRLQQRAISLEGVGAGLQWGKEVYQTGGTFRHTIGHREVRAARRVGVDLSAYLGLVLIALPNGRIITSYWNRTAARPKMAPHHASKRTRRQS